MKEYICTVILLLFSLITLITLVGRNKVLYKFVKSGLILSSALVMACAVAEVIGVVFGGGFFTVPLVFKTAKYIEICTTPLVPIALIKVFTLKSSIPAVFIPSIIHIALQTLSLFFGFMFYIDQNCNFRYGNFYWLYYLTIAVNILFLFVEAIKFSRKLQSRNYSSIIMIIIFIIIGSVFHIVDNEVRILWLTVTIGLILLYIYYCNMVYQIEPTTMLLNRRAYDTHKILLNKRAYIIVFDVNNFKDINDKFGHITGDSYLKFVANAIKTVYGKIGLCYRVGGDEFCVITDRKTHATDVERLNEKFSKLLADKNIMAEYAPSVAIGYEFFDDKKSNIYEVIKSADKKMYINKTNKKS